jgi:hypothetical protein
MTIKKAKQTRIVSEATRRKQSESKTMSHAETRENNIKALKVMVAIVAIEATENDGVYPEKSGRISGRAIAKRVGIHPTTLNRPGYKEIGGQIQTWVDSLKPNLEHEPPAYRGRRMSQAEKYEVLKLDFKAIEEHNLLLETDLLHTALKLKDATKMIEQLRTELERTLR